jgi:hypothetical protein
VWRRAREQDRWPIPEPFENQDDARVYVWLEEARLRCEELQSRATTALQRQALHRVHRELGLAGLFASSNMPTHVRHALLTIARQRCIGPLSQAAEEVEGLEVVMLRARDAVEYAAVVSGLSDHMHLAHVHLLRGQELVQEQFAGNLHQFAPLHQAPR